MNLTYVLMISTMSISTFDRLVRVYIASTPLDFQIVVLTMWGYPADHEACMRCTSPQDSALQGIFARTTHTYYGGTELYVRSAHQKISYLEVPRSKSGVMISQLIHLSLSRISTPPSLADSYHQLDMSITFLSIVEIIFSFLSNNLIFTFKHSRVESGYHRHAVST